MKFPCRIRTSSKLWPKSRAGQLAWVIKHDPERKYEAQYLVRFSNSFPGGGIDGDKLWLEYRDFEIIKKPNEFDQSRLG
ncbi:MAG: hypothetical protein ACRD5H_00195 [Nitrososphaerales archaeon]